MRTGLEAVVLKKAIFDTPMGELVAVADDEALYMLGFAGYSGLEEDMERIERRVGVTITPGSNAPIEQIQNELKDYFKGVLHTFKTAVRFLGTPFQIRVWQELRRIPYGKTCSYADLAKAIGKPTAFRAVAGANGANLFAIIIPCHRVINADGKIGGYASGIHRKQWLLDLENSK